MLAYFFVTFLGYSLFVSDVKFVLRILLKLSRLTLLRTAV